MHAFDRRTDGQTGGQTDKTDRQTDRIPIAIPRLHSMQRGKNVTKSLADSTRNSVGQRARKK